MYVCMYVYMYVCMCADKYSFGVELMKQLLSTDSIFNIAFYQMKVSFFFFRNDVHVYFFIEYVDYPKKLSWKE